MTRTPSPRDSVRCYHQGTSTEQPGTPRSCQDLPSPSPEGQLLTLWATTQLVAQVSKRALEATEHELADEGWLTCREVVWLTDVFRTQRVDQQYRLSSTPALGVRSSPSCMGSVGRGEDILRLTAINDVPRGQMGCGLVLLELQDN